MAQLATSNRYILHQIWPCYVNSFQDLQSQLSVHKDTTSQSKTQLLIIANKTTIATIPRATTKITAQIISQMSVIRIRSFDGSHDSVLKPSWMLCKEVCIDPLLVLGGVCRGFLMMLIEGTDNALRLLERLSSRHKQLISMLVWQDIFFWYQLTFFAVLDIKSMLQSCCNSLKKS